MSSAHLEVSCCDLSRDTVKLENYLTEDSVAYYAAVGFDRTFALERVPSWVYAPGSFSPVPLQLIEIDSLFYEDQFDRVAMVELLYDMVHPKETEVVAGSVRSFLNLAIIPDFILEDDACLCLLDFKN